MPGGRSSIMSILSEKNCVSDYIVPSTLESVDMNWIPKRQDRKYQESSPRKSKGASHTNPGFVHSFHHPK